MGITDRIILTVYTVLMAAFALLLMACVFGLIPVVDIVDVISQLPGSWEYALGGAVVFLISIRLLLAGIGLLGSDSDLVLADVENGKTTVTKRALENYIADIAQEVYGIYGVKVKVDMEDKKTISASINASLEPGVNVFEITEEVKDNVKETIKKVVGLDINNIQMHFKQFKNSGKNNG